MIDMTEPFTKEDAKKNKSEGIVLDCFGINKCFDSVFKREKNCTFGIVFATKKSA